MKKFSAVVLIGFIFMAGCASTGYKSTVFDKKTDYDIFFDASLLAMNEMGYQTEFADKNAGAITGANYADNVWYAGILPRISVVIIKTKESLIASINSVSRADADKAGEFLRRAERRYAALTGKTDSLIRDTAVKSIPAETVSAVEKSEENRVIEDVFFEADKGIDAEIKLDAEVLGFMMSPSKRIKNSGRYDWTDITVYFIYETEAGEDTYMKKMKKISRKREVTVKPDDMRAPDGSKAPKDLGEPDIVRIVAYEKGKKGFYEKKH
ncbi:MAG TPA: hypothetical protein ENN55_00565 [Firmicutes bacterium]|mgnify:CR=1 FL=1|nr:hypothetical protein [Bacillota bacterium]